MSEKAVIIAVSGGVAEVVHADPGVDVYIFDADSDTRHSIGELPAWVRQALVDYIEEQ